jgi:hypothetical protein
LGLTISGAEPLEQTKALLPLLAMAWDLFHNIIIFTGYSEREIELDAHKSSVLRYADALVTGRFHQNDLAAQGLRGSNNQRILLAGTNAPRLRAEDLETFEHAIEVHEQGIVTGFPPAEEEICPHL